jgi:hypothetical protein
MLFIEYHYNELILSKSVVKNKLIFFGFIKQIITNSEASDLLTNGSELVPTGSQ